MLFLLQLLVFSTDPPAVTTSPLLQLPPWKPGNCPSPPQSSGACMSDVSCRLNGACDEQSGKCVCDQGWTGEFCQYLDLLPGHVAYGSPSTPNTSAWGGGPPTWDETTQQYHLFATEIAGNCGMATWGRMSQMVHATSPTSNGPYTRVSTALPTETHNVFYVYSKPDKMHLIYAIGPSNNPPSCNPRVQCFNGTTPGTTSLKPPPGWAPETCAVRDMSIRVHYSPSLDGPWLQSNISLPDVPYVASPGSNPAPLIFDNGTVLVMTRSANQMIINGTDQHYQNVWLFSAPSWNSTYTWVHGPGDNGAMCIGGDMQTEDPVLWKGRRGYHAIFHQNLTHAWSTDALNWHWSSEATATTMFQAPDGSLQIREDHERPRVVLTHDGDVDALFIASMESPYHSDAAQLVVYAINGSARPTARTTLARLGSAESDTNSNNDTITIDHNQNSNI
eukprot:m.41121 g.41121  ORF g.41121 m.41121 type:complete len:447 (-) comp18709_c0_seq2:30-1370(-)